LPSSSYLLEISSGVLVVLTVIAFVLFILFNVTLVLFIVLFVGLVFNDSLHFVRMLWSILQDHEHAWLTVVLFTELVVPSFQDL